MSWTNDKPLTIRSKIAIKVLLLIVQVLEPYEFKHEFSKDFDAIKKDLDEKAGK